MRNNDDYAFIFCHLVQNGITVFTVNFGGGPVVRWCWLNFQCRGVFVIWIVVEQGPTALTIGADGVVWTFFPRLSFLFSFSLSLGDGPM